MKDSMVSKVCSACEEMYTDALRAMQKDSVKALWEREWLPAAQAKQAAFRGLTQHHQAAVCRAGKAVGEEIARLQVGGGGGGEGPRGLHYSVCYSVCLCCVAVGGGAAARRDGGGRGGARGGRAGGARAGGGREGQRLHLPRARARARGAGAGAARARRQAAAAAAGLRVRQGYAPRTTGGLLLTYSSLLALNKGPTLSFHCLLENRKCHTLLDLKHVTYL